jgi:hypothetical protein
VVTVKHTASCAILTKSDAIAFAHDVLAAAGHVPEAAPRVVGVTASDLVQARALAGLHKMGSVPSFDHAIAHELTHMLAARAGAADADTIPVRVIRRPVETAEALVVPEDGWYARQYADGWALPTPMSAGEFAHPEVQAIRRWNAEDGTLSHQRERTATTTARAWTAGDVPEGDVIVCGAIPDSPHIRYSCTFRVPRWDVAETANRYDATHILVLPATLDGGK